MSTLGFALFATPIGHCGIAWGERGLTGVQLPEADEAGTRKRMQLRFPGCLESVPPPAVQESIRDVVALLRGQPNFPEDLSTIVLDMEDVPPFRRRVYELARAIPPGTTLTYGEIARRMGEPQSAQAVGQALGNNPFAPVVPCLRVLAAGARAGGFSASGGVVTKLRMLQIERASFDGPGLFDDHGAP